MVVQKISDKIKNSSKKELVLVSLFIGVVFGLAVSYLWYSTSNLNDAELTKRVKDYIDNNILEMYNFTANITDVKRFNSISVIRLNIIDGKRKISEGEVYVSNDGQFMIVGMLYNLSKPIEKVELQQTEEQPEEIPKEVEKREKPDVKLFVMSYCPYGIQAENAMWPVLDLLGDKVNFELHYVIYPATYYNGVEDEYCINKTYCAMHGVQELNENIRQICIMNKYDYSVWKEYIKAVSSSCNYRNVDSCWEGVAKSKGIDVEYVKQCYNENALKYAEKEYQLNLKYNVQGSPMLFINDVQYEGGRTPEAYKKAICDGFTNPPASCDTALSGESSPVSGSCG
ncbi:MAG: hypothetical protein NZ903_00025 [Candidatus Micrarchaeota archaeon]|nr:hypothetical protein [Candidatus Micrarchaeota archaeon]